MQNRLVLQARVVEVAGLRQTPAGVPAIDVVLEHESRLVEVGIERDVRFSIKAVAFGTVAESLARQTIGVMCNFSGFLAAPKNGKHPVLHILDFQPNSI